MTIMHNIYYKYESNTYNKTCPKQPAKGPSTMTLESRWLLNTDQFGLKRNIWNHKLLTFKGKGSFIEETANIGSCMSVFRSNRDVNSTSRLLILRYT